MCVLRCKSLPDFVDFAFAVAPGLQAIGKNTTCKNQFKKGTMFMEHKEKESVRNTFVTKPKATKALLEYEHAKDVHEKMLARCEQLDHQITQMENKISYQQKQERKRRTHRLCTRAGHIESLLPETKELTDNQFMAFCDALFSYPKMKELVSKLLAKVKEEN